MRFTTLAYKNVIRRRGRTLLTVCGLSAAVAAVVALVGVSNGFMHSFNAVYESHNVDLVVSRKGAADRLSSAMDEAFAERIGGLEHVKRASALLLETMSLEQEGVYGIPMMGIRPESAMMSDYTIRDGRRISADDERVVLLGSQLATRLEQKLGDRVVFFEEEGFEVVGIFESYSTLENGSIIMPMAELQRLTDRKGQVTFVNVMLSGPPTSAAVEAAVNAIEGMDDKLSAMPTQDFVKTDTRIRIAGAMAWMTSSIALLIGAIGMLNTMMTSVYERTREIGILRAIGWTKLRIVRMILIEASLLSVAAATLGILVGVFATWWMSRVPSVAGTISPHVDWSVTLQGFTLAVAIGLLGASYPAYRGARLVPRAALRHE